MNSGVSIVICCHNSSLRLPKTLDCIKNQVVDDEIPWEVIVVDNASTDDTARVAIESWALNERIDFQVVMEGQQGLSFARSKGIEQSKYEFISFIDDDNWIDSNYVQTVYQLMTVHPEVGACGGKSIGVFESDPPAWYKNYYSRLAIGEQYPIEGDITNSRGWLWGAGLTIRKQAWKQILSKKIPFLLTGRKGKQLMSGEDNELCYILRLLGWKLYYSPRLILKHYIPAARLTWNYICKLVASNGFSSVVMYRYKEFFAKRLPLASFFQYLRVWLSRIYTLWILTINARKNQANQNHPGSSHFIEYLSSKEQFNATLQVGPGGFYNIDMRIVSWTKAIK